MQGKQLERKKDNDNGQQRYRHFAHKLRQLMQVGGPDGSGIGKGGCGNIQRTAAFGIEEAQNKHRQNRPDGAERDQTEAVRFGTGVASYVGNTDAQRQNKGNGHRAGGHAAGVKRNA